MKILIVSSYLPYPLIDGGKVRLYNLLKNLNEKHEITLICEKRKNQTLEDEEEVLKVCKKLITINRSKAWSIKNISKSLLSFDSLLITSHTNSDFKKKIKNEIDSEKYNLIHVETFYVFQNLPKTDIPIVVVEHNVEYEVYEKFASKSSFIIRPGLKYDILKLKRKEKLVWGRANKVIAVSKKEQKIIGKNSEVVPNGVDLKKFKFIKKNLNKKEKKVLFIGNFGWIQNRDSAAFIIKNIWPKILSKNPDYKLWIVGKNIPENIKTLADSSIIFDENAPKNTELIFQEADVLLAPIRVGGGTNFKILEAMASGTPVVTSMLGNEGIQAEKNSQILIAEKPEEYVSAIDTILNDNYLFKKISRNARIFIEENFDWNKIALKLESVYESLIKK